LLRRQLTVHASWTFSAVGQEECARFVADHKIPLKKLLTHRFRLDQAEEAYRLFDTQTTGKGVFMFACVPRHGPPCFLLESATPPRTPRQRSERPSEAVALLYDLAGLARLQMQSGGNRAALRNLVEAFERQVEDRPRRDEHHREVDGGGGDVKRRQREVFEDPVARGV